MDDSIRDFYASKRLPRYVHEQIVRAWHDQLANAPAGHSAPAGRRPRLWHAALAASVLALTLAAVLWLENSARDRSIAALAEQLVASHRAELPLDVASPDFEAIVAALAERLELEPIAPTEMVERGYRIVGGSITRVAEEPALHLRLLAPDGRAVSLIQVRASARLAQVEVDSLRINGLEVKMWMTGPVLCCLVTVVA